MAAKKIKSTPIDDCRGTSEILETEKESENAAVKTESSREETGAPLSSDGLKLIPGETLIKTIEGMIEGEPRTVKVYYGNYVIPMINGRFRPLKREVYQKALNEFLDSQEGSRYDRPSKEENEEALAEVRRVVEAYLKKQEILKASNIMQPGRTLPGPEQKQEEIPAREKDEEEPEEKQTFKDDVPSEEAKAIEFIRNKNYTRQQIKEIRKGFDSEKRRSALATVMIIMISLAALALAIYLIKDIVVKAHALIELELKQSEITIRAGDPFNPSDYIKYVTKDDSIYIIYPSLDTKDVGVHDLEYVATNGIKNVKKTLTANVIDGESPVIRLKEEEILLVRGRDEENFDPMDYVKETSDNLDEKLEVEVNELDWSKDEQSLSYRVKDSSGNSGSAQLLVKIEDMAVCDRNASYNPSTNTCRCKSGYTGDGTACRIVSTSASSPAETSSSGESSGSSSPPSQSTGASSSTSWSESWTVDYTDYQPSNGQSDVTYTNNDTGESHTVTDSDVGPYESDEDLWNEIDSLTGN
ncbi:MAG: hypothetical protein IKD94_00025 [Erysipelotrichaceae bacterium]|nr:hypothetical protein [Erysipelotrichaceae bacterium]